VTRATAEVDAVFEALAHPARREILRRLAARELTANELAEPFDMSRPAVSQHLRVLREAGLVRDRKVGRHQLYVLDPATLQAADRWLEHFRQFWPAKLERLGQVLERRRK
jgi:DNA-binding transcriptional ArsR family regulator